MSVINDVQMQILLVHMAFFGHSLLWEMLYISVKSALLALFSKEYCNSETSAFK